MQGSVEALEDLIRSRLPAYCSRHPNTSADRFVTVSRTARPSGRPFPDEAAAFLQGVAHRLCHGLLGTSAEPSSDAVGVQINAPLPTQPGCSLDARPALGSRLGR